MTTDWPSTENVELVQSVVRSILEASDPVPATTRCAESLLAIGAPIALLAVGKAAVPMASAALDALGDRVARALVVTTEHPNTDALRSRAEVLVGDHPLATDRNVRAAERVLGYARAPEGRDQFLLVLLSGGGSALLTLPASGLPLEDLTRVSGSLMRAGCPIDGLNCVRKHCELLKGGRLAALSSAMRIKVCVLSDVIGDPLSTIASGPFAPDPTTFADAMRVLEEFDCVGVSDRITAHLRAGTGNAHQETHKPGDPIFDCVSHEIVLSNKSAVNAAAEALRLSGLNPHVLNPNTGETKEAARDLARALGKDRAVVMGGEPVVSEINEGSRGGPMQEAVLSAALEFEADLFDWLVIGFATDGRDGPTDAAGAAIDRAMLRRARSQGLPLELALEHHDAYSALNTMHSLIRTGPTGTNVNDVLIAIRR